MFAINHQRCMWKLSEIYVQLCIASDNRLMVTHVPKICVCSAM